MKNKINSKKTGNAFEREVANYLTKLTGSKFQRVPMSGAFATQNNSNDPRFNGDVFTEDPKYSDTVIECKKSRSMDLNDLFHEKSKFWNWVKQSDEESKGKAWILFIKRVNKGWYVLIDVGVSPSNLHNNLLKDYDGNVLRLGRYNIYKIK